MKYANKRYAIFYFLAGAAMLMLSGFSLNFSQNEKIQLHISLITHEQAALLESFDRYVEAFWHNADGLASAREAFERACLSYKKILEETHDDMAQAHSLNSAATQMLDLGNVRSHMRERIEAHLPFLIRLKRLVAAQADPLEAVNSSVNMLEKLERIFLKITVHDYPVDRQIAAHRNAVALCPHACESHKAAWTGSWACPAGKRCVCNCRDNLEDNVQPAKQKSEL